MVTPIRTGEVVDPADLLNRALERAWECLCQSFDVHADLPDLRCLADGVDLSIPGQAARTILVNMLLEVMESVGRFSPWYRQPARAYGLISVQDSLTPRKRWALAPEAIQKWWDILEPLAIAVRKNSGLIQAIIFVEGLMSPEPCDDPEIVVCCHCLPPRSIQARRSVLDQADIVCDACLHPFT